MIVRFKLGIQRPTVQGVPYVARYEKRGEKIVVMRMYRQLCGRALRDDEVAFVPRARYQWTMYLDDVRSAIKEALDG